MRLRHIETVHFGSSEHTNYLKLCELHPRLKALADDDVVLLQSRRGDQLVFLHGFGEVQTNGDPKLRVQYLRSEKVRLTKKNSWSPLMLANYARAVGIRLDGILTFEQHLAKLRKQIDKALKAT
jgi:hypothetical protein